MLLQTLPLFGNSWCDNTSLIKCYMKGISQLKPPMPRYKFTWNVSLVLAYLKTLHPLSDLSLKDLTLKTIALIALATAPRAQTLVSMNVNNYVKEQQAVVFTFSTLLKTSKYGQAYSLKIDHFKEETLCPMHTLLFYLQKTKSLRKSSQVFVSYVTFKAMCTGTIARWLKTVLQCAGINIKVFKAHSYRGAATSAASLGGCSLKNILDMADWS